MEKIYVKDVHRLHGTASTTITKEAHLADIIMKYANEPEIRGIFLIDEKERFSGMVSRLAILKWAEYQLSKAWSNDTSSGEIKHDIDLVKAKKLARGDWQSFGVKESDTLEDAFKKMISVGEDILPIIDDNGKIIGDLRLSEVLQKVIEINT